LNSGSNLYVYDTGIISGTFKGSVTGSLGINGNVSITGSIVASGTSLVSGSSQISITGTTGYSTFSSSVSTSIGSLSSSIATTTSGLSASIDSLSSSIATTTGNLSSSVATTTSGLASRIGSVETKSGSYATTGSNIFVGSQVITGSLYITNDMVVQGCSCLQNITASAVSIGTNVVMLNTATPAVRFAGISVQDSGSNAGVTGSIFWDGLCNKWIYSNPSNVGYSGGMLLSGPRNTSGTIGNESPLTCNVIAKSGGDDHIYDSCIIDDGTTVCINANLKGSGTACFSGAITNSTSTTDSYVASFSQTNTTADHSFGLLVRGGTSSNDVAFRIQNASAGANFLSVLGSGISSFTCQVCAPTFDSNCARLVGKASASPYANSSWLQAPDSSGMFIVNSGITNWIGVKADGSIDSSGTFTHGGTFCASNTICAPTFSGDIVTTKSATFTDGNVAVTGCNILIQNNYPNAGVLVGIKARAYYQNCYTTSILFGDPNSDNVNVITFNTGNGDVSPTERLRISSLGVACFSSTVCGATFVGNVGCFTTSICSTYAFFPGISVGGNPVSAGTSATAIRFTNSGGDLYIGQESCTASNFYPGSKVYDNVFYTSCPYNFIIGGKSVLYMTSGGCVGVRTSSPRATLHVQQCTNDGVPTAGCARDGLIISSNNGNYGLNIGVDPTGPSWIQSMRFDSAIVYNLLLQPSGGCSVLIGTGTALSGCRQQLIIGGNSYGSTIAMGNNGDANKFVIESDTGENVLINNKSNTPMIFYTNNCRRMDILGNGCVGIGCTSPGAQLVVGGACNGDTTLHLQSGTVSGKLSFSNNTANTIYGGGWWGYMGYSSATYHLFGQCVSITGGLSVTSGDVCFAGQICSTGTQTITGPGLFINRPASSSGEPYIFFNKDGVNRASIYGGDGTAGLRFFSSVSTFSGNIVPDANGTRDLGSSSLRWCTVYTSDLSLNNGIGNYTIVEGESDLFLYNNNSCKVFKFLLQEVCKECAPAKMST
jgi:hypothetical protein